MILPVSIRKTKTREGKAEQSRLTLKWLLNSICLLSISNPPVNYLVAIRCNLMHRTSEKGSS